MTEPMFEYNETILRKIIFHRVSIDKHKLLLNESTYDYNAETEAEILKSIFLRPFINCSITYEFKHHIDIALNPLYKIARELYEGGKFEKKSKDIFQHLQSVSQHPNIKDGELFIIQFEDIKINNKYYEALGIYKVENKETFIDTSSDTGKTGLFFKKGISSKKLDKACLIIFTENTYTILVIDNGTTETDYWINDFINVNPKSDSLNSTNHFLTIAKNFVTEQLPNEYEVTRALQIDYLNKSVEYFKSHETFNKKEFEQTVFEDDNVIDSFRKFDKAHRKDSNMAPLDKFDISSIAVKKQTRIFKSVIKLDKNFHIYVHGNTSLIEQGVEKDGRRFYKIYFDQEF